MSALIGYVEVAIDRLLENGVDVARLKTRQTDISATLILDGRAVFEVVREAGGAASERWFESFGDRVDTYVKPVTERPRFQAGWYETSRETVVPGIRRYR